MSKRAHFWTLLGLIGLAFALRVGGLTFQSLWRDEVDAILFAGRPLADLLQMAVSPGQNGGLYFSALHLWLRVAGRSEFALRFFSVMAGVLAVPVVYRLSRRLPLSTPRVALVAALLLATSPYLVWYGQEGKMYSSVVLVAALSMERHLAAMQCGGLRRWLSYVIITAAACYVHLLAVLLIPAQVGVFVLLRGGRRAPRWKPWLASLLLLLVLCLPLLEWQLPMLLTPGETGYAFVPLPRMLSSLFGTYSLGVVEPVAWWALAPHVVLLGSALSLKAGRARLESNGLLVCWLVVPCLCLYLVTLRQPVFTARYLSFVVPALALLMASGLQALCRYSRVLAGLTLLAMLAVNVHGLWLQARTPIKADFRAATLYVEDRLEQEQLILFQIPHGRFSFEYYFGRDRETSGSLPLRARHRIYLPWIAAAGQSYRWADGLYTNAGVASEEVDRRMREIVGESRLVWLIASEMEMWDERGLVEAWLDRHSSSSDVAEFVRVAVHRYELP